MADKSMFGKSKFGGGFKEFKKPISVEENTKLTFRYVPPIAKFTDDFAVFHRVHWGYKGLDRKVPGKTQLRTFRCPMEVEYKTKRVITPCAEHAKIEEQETLLKDKEAIFKAKNMSTEESAEFLQPLRDWIKQHNVDSKWYSNILTEARKIEVLRYPHKAKQAIEQAVKDYKEKLVKQGKAEQAESFDPNDPDGGCWFTLARTGTGTNTAYSATIVEDFIPVKLPSGEEATVSKLKSAALTDADVTLIDAEAVDLNGVVRALTPDQIDRVVNCSGSPEEVDAIFNQGQRTEQKAAHQQIVAKSDAEFEAQKQKVIEEAAKAAEAKKTEEAAAQQAAKVAESVRAKATIGLTPAAEEDEEAKLERQLAEARARKAAKVAATEVKAEVKVEPKPEAKVDVKADVNAQQAAVKGLGDQEFLKLFGTKPTPPPTA